MCRLEKSFNTNESESDVDVNSAITLAIISTEVGYSAAEEIMSILNIPFMASKTYQQYHENVASVIHDAAWKSMEEAAICYEMSCWTGKKKNLKKSGISENGIKAVFLVSVSACWTCAKIFRRINSKIKLVYSVVRR
ncbi:hypothetical protein ILUMI_20703 [Ignelater luminosus]|uniref:Mutator-like transposase domain-containing protein n=1 Tax=Ignelater luminosus TaxID=2038154 RepID=A0A8K0CKC6_IGNLU|nr:hypothetical protein ILUMI_20703 [Ignelater luminosus]